MLTFCQSVNNCLRSCKPSYRSHPDVFCKKDVLENFAKFTEKLLCQSLFFNKVTGPRPATLLQKRLRHRWFPVSFAKVLKARIHCEIFLSEDSWNTYFTIVSLCKRPINIHDVLFEAFHEIRKFWKSIFRIFSIVKDFPIEFVFMLINSFVINDVCKNLKENVNIKVKSKHKVVLRTLLY